MLGVLAIVGILSIAALVGFTYAMNKHRANETIYDVMLRGTNVPMVDENYASKPAGHEFTFPDLPSGTYYPTTTKKDAGSSYYVEATGVTYRVCELILKMNPTDIDRIMVGDTAYAGDSDICGTTDGLAMKFCFGEDGAICNGTGGGGSGSGSGSGSGTEDPCDGIDCGSHGVCNNGVCDCTNGYAGVHCEMPPACTTDEECTDGEVCTDYECVCPPLAVPTECQEITSVKDGCDQLTNLPDGTECLKDNQLGKCNAGVCERQCTPACEACEECIDGQCIALCSGEEVCDVATSTCITCSINPTSKTCSNGDGSKFPVKVDGIDSLTENTTCCRVCLGEDWPTAYWDGEKAVCCYGKVNQKEDGSFICCPPDKLYWAPTYFKYTGVGQIEKSDWGCSACPESEMYFTADERNNAKYGECACPDGQHAVSTEYASRICCSEKVEGFYLWSGYYPQCCYESTPKLFNGPSGVQCCRTDAVGVDKNGNCCNPPDKLIGSTCCGEDATGLDEDGNCEY